jgi:hypothetical protein
MSGPTCFVVIFDLFAPVSAAKASRMSDVFN